MSVNKEKEIFNDLSSSMELDDIFLSPRGHSIPNARKNDTEVFFNSGYSNTPGLIEPKQIRIKKAKQISREEQENLITNQKLMALYKFFDSHPFVSITNFHLAQKLLDNYFDDPTKYIDRIVKLKEYLPAAFQQNHKFGQLKLDCSYRGTFIKISIARTKLKDTEQYLSINLVNNKPDHLLVFSQWNWKNKKYQIIRSADIANRRLSGSPSSLEFDAKVWQAYNFNGIARTNFLKSLDCVERNFKNLGAFINSVNHKTILNLFEKPLISNASIKTDNQSTSLLNFRTNTSQKVEMKISKHLTSLTLEH